MLPLNTGHCASKSLAPKWYRVLVVLALLPLPALAQGGRDATAPRHQRQYMTLTTVESADPHLAKMVLAPAPHAASEVYLEGYNGFTAAGNDLAYRHNQERLARQLDELAADGWEVLEVHPAPYLPAEQSYSTRYLLQRIKP